MPSSHILSLPGGLNNIFFYGVVVVPGRQLPYIYHPKYIIYSSSVLTESSNITRSTPALKYVYLFISQSTNTNPQIRMMYIRRMTSDWRIKDVCRQSLPVIILWIFCSPLFHFSSICHQKMPLNQAIAISFMIEMSCVLRLMATIKAFIVISIIIIITII